MSLTSQVTGGLLSMMPGTMDCPLISGTPEQHSVVGTVFCEEYPHDYITTVKLIIIACVMINEWGAQFLISSK